MARMVSSPSILGPRCAGHPIPHNDTRCRSVKSVWQVLWDIMQQEWLGDGRKSGKAVRSEERQGEPQWRSRKRGVLTLEDLGAEGSLAGLQLREESPGKLVLSSPSEFK